MSSIRLAVHGAAGRMGLRLIALGDRDPDLEIVAALESAQHPSLGQDAGLAAGIGAIGVMFSNELPREVDVVIDFSLPAGAAAISQLCGQRQIPLVMATTGLDASQQQAVLEAAERTAVVWAPNMSLAVNLTMKLATTAAEVLQRTGADADVEIVERHHRFKADAPSGTALQFGQMIAAILGQQRQVHGRQGALGARPRDEIGYHALRVGDNPGEHTIVLGMLGETVELTVRATNRDCYALGALTAAKFAVQQSPGRYSMREVLGL